jgi:hypothetical protein
MSIDTGPRGWYTNRSGPAGASPPPGRSTTRVRCRCQSIATSLAMANPEFRPEKGSSMAIYVGLTDSPDRRKREHGDPVDWSQRWFVSEGEARAWEQQMLTRGCQGSAGGQGWRYGYLYTITPSTKQ